MAQLQTWAKVYEVSFREASRRERTKADEDAMKAYQAAIAAGENEGAAGQIAHTKLNAAKPGPDRIVFGRIDEIKTAGGGGIGPRALENAIAQAKRYANERNLKQFTVIFYDCKLGGKFYFSGKL